MDVIVVVCDFFCTSHMPYGLNSNFLTPIPKIPDAYSLGKFCLIVMANFLFKIITKSLMIDLP